MTRSLSRGAILLFLCASILDPPAAAAQGGCTFGFGGLLDSTTVSRWQEAGRLEFRYDTREAWGGQRQVVIQVHNPTRDHLQRFTVQTTTESRGDRRTMEHRVRVADLGPGESDCYVAEKWVGKIVRLELVDVVFRDGALSFHEVRLRARVGGAMRLRRSHSARTAGTTPVEPKRDT